MSNQDFRRQCKGCNANFACRFSHDLDKCLIKKQVLHEHEKQFYKWRELDKKPQLNLDKYIKNCISQS